MTLTTVLYGLADGVATITLNRPDSRNALNRAMCEDIVAATAAAAADRDVRLVLVRATGPVFCAGADLKERKDMSIDDVRTRRLRGYAAYNAIEAAKDSENLKRLQERTEACRKPLEAKGYVIVGPGACKSPSGVYENCPDC